jgi:sugar lactone lactonase YvrE
MRLGAAAAPFGKMLPHRSIYSVAFAWFALAAIAQADLIYVPVADGNAVKRVNANGDVTNFATSGLVDPIAIIFDADGNAYVSDSNGGGSNGVIVKFPAGSSSPVPVASSLAGPTGLALDESGVLYAALAGESRIIKFNGAGFTTFATLTTGAQPQGIAFDSDGILFVAEKNTNSISEVSITGVVTLFSDDVTSPTAVAFDSSGSIHATDAQSGGRIARFNPQGKASTVVGSLGDVRGIVFDLLDNAYITTANDNALKQVAANKQVTGVAGSLLAPGLLALRSIETTVVAQKNEILTTDPVDARFASFGSPATNNARTVAFRATLVSGISGISSGNNVGLWIQREDLPRQLVARKSFPAAGVSGPIWKGFSDPVINDDDAIAFRATLMSGIGGITSANSVGLWAGMVGNLQLVAQKGAHPPGTGNGVRFASFSSFALPDQTGLVFVARIAGPGVNLANDTGLWAVDTDGIVQLIQRKGNTVTIDGNKKTLAGFTILNAVPFATGQTRHFTAKGDFVYLAKFTDGTTAILRATFP